MQILAISESAKELRLLRGYWRAMVVIGESETARRRRSQGLPGRRVVADTHVGAETQQSAPDKSSSTVKSISYHLALDLLLCLRKMKLR
jgi:hypothetical protein